ncbi:hypothetical protein D9O40_10485 [Clostridium autoethanogenum]|jgi:hypothetical protein|uniref:Uncharacterized protein n=1 Tax=Clostridium autoethanogenum TaxID=84023 RepID=A0A3M0SP23_9CLOT|nr:hypothetical protein [Clostridium autoethanogenum]RMD00249.1 hypothetical protein D9O40_10485 [Clostridium autoethanogenum]
MSDDIVITSIVCVTIVSIVGIFAILAYLKEKTILKYKNSFKDSDNEIAITVDSNKHKNSKN